MDQNDMLYAHILILFPIITAAIATCPPIVGRDEWNARPAMSKVMEQHPATHIVLHHSSTATCKSQTNCAALIGEDGNVYEGVGWGRQGTHEGRLNSRSIGICFLGDYTSWLPNETALSAMHRLIECGVENGHLTAEYKLITHSQLKHTDCPGQKLYHYARGLEHWVSGP